MSWASGYVGLPFKDGGRDKHGCDCWGLARMVLLDQRGIELPSYGAIGAKELASVARMMTVVKDLPPWVQVDAPQEFDIVTMFGRPEGRKAICHVGIAIDARRVLHVEEATDSVAVSLDHPSVKFRLGGFYRHEGLL